MKKKTIILIALLVLAQRAFGLTPIGIPGATLEKGEYEINFSYMHSEMDIELNLFGTDETFDTKINTYLPKLDIGLGRDWQFSFGLGLANIDAENFRDNNSFWDIGMKKTLAQQGDIDWGICGRVYWSSFHDKVFLGAPNISDVDITYYEAQLAFGPTYRKDNWCIYGGPFLHYLDGDADVNDVRGDFSVDVEKDLSVGAFVGFLTNITDNIDFGFEAQFAEDAEAIVFRFRYKF